MSGTPPLDYERAEPVQPSGLRFVHYLVIAGILALLISILLPSSHRHRHGDNQVKCASNLRQIGQAIQLYAYDNHGLLPPDPQTIAATQQISLDCFVCVSTSDIPATKPDELTIAGRRSYIYVGTGLSTRSDPECIVALEDPANHGLEGGNVLFADGHVEFFELPTIQQILNELNASRNPPATLTPTLSQAGAEQDYQQNWQPRMPQLKTGVWRIPTTQPANAPK